PRAARDHDAGRGLRAFRAQRCGAVHRGARAGHGALGSTPPGPSCIQPVLYTASSRARGVVTANCLPGQKEPEITSARLTDVASQPDPLAATGVLDDSSLEMTGKDVENLRAARASTPPGTRINVTFLGNEDLEMRLAAARAARAHGFVPVPHISARRLGSSEMLEEFLAGLRDAGACEDAMVVAGDPATPEGPYEDSMSLIRCGLLERYRVRHGSVRGYPDGHPALDERALWSAFDEKFAALAQRRLAGSVLTQFGFDVDPVVTWIEAVRGRGVDAPIRVGVPGPAGVKRLLSYAK